jgi:Domain of Unknown Function (DUF1080)
VTDAGPAYFKDCTSLTWLGLSDTEVTDAGLERLAGFRKLASLSVKNTKVTETGVKKLAAALPRCKIEWDGGVIEPTANAATTPASSKRFSARRGPKGKWIIVDDHLEQTSFDPNACLYFGNPAWTDYDFVVDVMQGNGNDQVCQLFRARRGEGICFYGLASFRNSQFTVEYQPRRLAPQGRSLRLSKKEGHIHQGQWYTMLVRVRGPHAECFVDGTKTFDFECGELPSGCVGLRTWATEYRFRNIKITAPDGTVLLEGLPDLN